MYDSESQNSGTTITVNVGTPGKIRAVKLDSTRNWTVADVLNTADISAEGYDVRIDGNPSTSTSLVFDQQTVLLIAPVLGN